ncbi:MAG: NupC/NupG family nucleoside CNT transporter [Deltaproteobacteria bacterium]|jgi:CNT family concentrative nucleoside transporter|nr:NupC/NupG family nucleoside CNT transporter [Deltaproteobacteria bacterium]MBW2500315.1 NupC/NupG family nucleoside CNT transporter [Deltaproteobacteria bacterium]
MSEVGLRALSGVGFVTLLAIAWLCSSARGRIDWRATAWGVGVQIALALVLLRTRLGAAFFDVMDALVGRLLAYTQAGTRFVFGPLLDTGFSFALGVLPIIVFMGSLFGTLYYLGWVQPIVRVLARALSRTMRTSGAESLAAVANVFVGLIEAGLVVRPYLARMTRSELFAFMTLGMSTIAGSVLLAYVQILGGADYAGHLVAASLISAPAGLTVAKLMLPETETPETLGQAPLPESAPAVNLIDAAAEGGLAGMRLAANIGALLLAFVALIALANDLAGAVGGLFGHPELSFQAILGFLLAPIAFVMGVPWSEASEVASLIGIKTVLNEFLAYQGLAEAIAEGRLSERSAVIAAYALCGFANFGSLAILLGGIQGIAPERRPEAASLGLRSILAGTIATCMTGCLAGVML